MFKKTNIARACALLLATAACVAGCDRAQPRMPEKASQAPAAKPPVPRQEDPAYQENLRNVVAERRKPQRDLSRAADRLRALEDAARRALPAGATPEQVKAELEGNPRKYPAYRELVAAVAAAKGDLKKNFQDAQRMIRERVQRENAERAQGASPAAN